MITRYVRPQENIAIANPVFIVNLEYVLLSFSIVHNIKHEKTVAPISSVKPNWTQQNGLE
jgi:hypothetical protein